MFVLLWSLFFIFIYIYIFNVYEYIKSKMGKELLKITTTLRVLPTSTKEMSSSVIQLVGTRNVRDLGGHLIAGGGMRVRRGVIFRGDHLGQVPVEQASEVIVGKLHIHHTYDLRGVEEAKAGGLYDIPNVQRHAVPIDCANIVVAVKEFSAMTHHDAREWMMKCYLYLVDHCGPVFGGVLRDVVSQNVNSENAALFHCTAGKDRTGFLCYLLLGLLGVEESVILKDYLLTNECVLAKEPTLNPQQSAAAVFNLVDECYLRSAMKRIEEKYGGLFRYAEVQLGLSPKDISALKELLLE